MDLFLFFVFVSPSVMSVSCSLVVTRLLGKGDLMALSMYVMFSCAFVTFPYDVLKSGVVFDCIRS